MVHVVSKFHRFFGPGWNYHSVDFMLDCALLGIDRTKLAPTLLFYISNEKC